MQSGTWAVVRTKITQTARVPGAPALNRICLCIYLAFLFMPVGCWRARAPRMPRPGQTWVKCSLETGQGCVSSQSCVSSYALTLTEWPVLKWPLVALCGGVRTRSTAQTLFSFGVFLFGFCFCFFFVLLLSFWNAPLGLSGSVIGRLQNEVRSGSVPWVMSDCL